MSSLVDSRKYHGYTIELHYDDSGSGDPRDMDNLSVFALSHNSYNFPNDPEINFDDFGSWHEVLYHLVKEHGALSPHAVWMIDHSGLAFRTTKYVEGNPFADGGWDSGMIGFAYTTKERLKAIGTPPEHIDACIVGEVEEWGRYTNGEVYGYIVKDPQGNEIDDGDCWGFIGDEYAWEEAQWAVDAEIGHREQLANDIAADAMQTLVGGR